MFFMFSSCTANCQSVSCHCFLRSLGAAKADHFRDVPVPRRACGMADAGAASCRAGSSTPAGCVSCCWMGFGNCVVSVRGQDRAWLVGSCLLLLSVHSLTVAGFRVGHVGICLIRVAIGTCGGSRWCRRFFEILAVVPGIVSKRNMVDNMLLLAYSLSSFSSSSVRASSKRLPDLCMLWYFYTVLVAAPVLNSKLLHHTP